MIPVNVNSDDLEAEMVSRILDRFDQIDGGHWIWNSTVNSANNPVLLISRGPGKKGAKTFQVRRLIWETCQSPLKPGHVVYRTCKEDLCIAPLHMKACTPAEHMNLRRGAK